MGRWVKDLTLVLLVAISWSSVAARRRRPRPPAHGKVAGYALNAQVMRGVDAVNA
jgi:hypothetical protein